MSPQQHADRLAGIAGQFNDAMRDARNAGLDVRVNLDTVRLATAAGTETQVTRLGVGTALPLTPSVTHHELAMQVVNGDMPAGSAQFSPSRR